MRENLTITLTAASPPSLLQVLLIKGVYKEFVSVAREGFGARMDGAFPLLFDITELYL